MGKWMILSKPVDNDGGKPRDYPSLNACQYINTGRFIASIINCSEKWSYHISTSSPKTIAFVERCRTRRFIGATQKSANAKDFPPKKIGPSIKTPMFQPRPNQDCMQEERII